LRSSPEHYQSDGMHPSEITMTTLEICLLRWTTSYLYGLGHRSIVLRPEIKKKKKQLYTMS